MNDISSPLSNLSTVIGDVRKKLGGWHLRGILTTALTFLMFGRLNRIMTEMEKLAKAYQAGTLRRRRPRQVSGPDVAKKDGGTQPGGGARISGERPPAGERIWPTQFGWLVRKAGWEAVGHGSQLRAILEQPEMQEFLEACPRAVRTLSPLCRMLMVETQALRPWVKIPEKAPEPPVEKPKRVRKPRPKPDIGRVPIPRGVMSAVRRGRYGKIR